MPIVWDDEPTSSVVWDDQPAPAKSKSASAGLQKSKLPEPPVEKGFLESAWENMNPFPLLSDIGHVLAPAGEGEAARARLMAIPGNIIEPMAKRWASTGNALASGDFWKAIQQAPGIIPIIGEPAVQAGEELAQGRTSEGAGHLAGLLAPFIAGEVAPRALERVAKPLRTPISKSATAAKELNIPTLASEYSDKGTWGRRMLDRFLQNRALGREPYFEFKQGQNTAAHSAARGIGEKISPEANPLETGTAVSQILQNADEAQLKGLIDREAERAGRVTGESIAENRRGETMNRDLLSSQGRAQRDVTQSLKQYTDTTGPLHSPEATGQAFHAAVTDNVAAFKSEARKMYSELDEATKVKAKGPNTAVDIEPIQKFMRQLRQDLNGASGASAALKGVDVEKLKDVTGRFLRTPRYITFADAQDILSSLKSIGRDYNSLIQSRYPGGIRALTGKLETQVQDAATRAGVGDLYRKANDFYREGATLFNDSSVAKLMEKNPEQIADAIWKPGAVTQLKEVQAGLAGQPQAWDALRRRGVENLYERAMKDGVLDGAKLGAEWNKLGPDMQKALMGKDAANFTEQIRQLGMVQKPLELETPPGIRIEKPQPQKLTFTPQQQAIRSAAAKQPETLANQLLSRNGESFGLELGKALKGSPELFQQVRRHAFDTLIQKHSVPPVAGGEPILQGKSLVKEWRNLSPGQQSLIAGDHLPEINKLMSAVNAIDTQKLSTLHGAIYGGFLDPAAGAFGAGNLVRGEFQQAAAAVLFVTAPRLISRAITSPAGIKWLTEGMELPAGSQAAARWAARAPGAASLTKQPPRNLERPPVQGNQR